MEEDFANEDFFYEKEDIEKAMRVVSLLSPNIILRKRFMRAIKEAARITAETGREAGFHAYPHSNQIKPIRVFKGGCDHISGEHRITEEESDTPPVIFVHFHPEKEGAIIPSDADLYDLVMQFECYRRKVPVVSIIGMVRTPERADILWIQATRQLCQDSAFCLKYFPPEMSQEAQPRILEALAKAGFQVEILTANLR